MTFGVTDLGLIRDVLVDGVCQRQGAGLLPSAEVIRYPALLVWARDDEPETEKLVASYGYWNAESRHYIDILFCGWMFDGQVLPTIEEAERLPFSPTAFDLNCYVTCQNQVREVSTWEPSGDIDFLLVNFVCEPDLRSGDFDFSRALPLPVSKMIANGWITSMKALLQDITVQARRAYEQSATGAEWEILNKVAITKGGNAIWRWISKTFLKDAGAMYEQLNLYSYRDMARAAIVEASGR